MSPLAPNLGQPGRRRALRHAAGPLLGLALASAGWPLRAAGVATGATDTTDASRFDANFLPGRWLDQDGALFDWARLRGHVALFSLVYTGCASVCPVTTHALVQMRRSLPVPVQDDLRLVSVSIDPLGDTPTALKAFARRHEADAPAWRFISGSVAQVDRLGERLRLFPKDGPSTPATHRAYFWLVAPDGRLMQRYAADPPDTARLARDVQALHAARRG